MGQSPDEHNDSSTQATGTTEILLAEYSALRAEIDQRSNVQWSVFALQIGSVGVISSLAIASTSRIALLLLIPLLSYLLGNRYILHDYHIKLIHHYIQDSLSKRLQNILRWEGWKNEHTTPDTRADRWLTPTGWNVLHPTRLAFEGVSAVALAAAALAVLTWRNKIPSWYLVLGFAVLWVLGALATWFLHRSFNRASRT